MLHLVSHLGNEPPVSRVKPGTGCPCPWVGVLGTEPSFSSALAIGLGTKMFRTGLDQFIRIFVATENQRLKYKSQVQETQKS